MLDSKPWTAVLTPLLRSVKHNPGQNGLVQRIPKRNGEVLGPTDICRRAGIYLPEANQYYRDWVGSGIINLLEAKGEVRRLDGGKRELAE